MARKVRAIRTVLRIRGEQLILDRSSAATLQRMADARIVMEMRSGKYFREHGSTLERVDARIVRTLARTGLISSRPAEQTYTVTARGTQLIRTLNCEPKTVSL